MQSVRCMLVMVAILGCGRASAFADETPHDVARRARQAGQIVSLETILAATEKRFEGDLVEVELEHDDGRWVYELELLTSGGKVLELQYDAATGHLLEVDGHAPLEDGKSP